MSTTTRRYRNLKQLSWAMDIGVLVVLVSLDASALVVATVFVFAIWNYFYGVRSMALLLLKELEDKRHVNKE